MTEEDQKQDEEYRQLAFERFPHQISYDYHFKYARKNSSFAGF
ncbi:hypothetical protein SGB_05290 [Shigella boydii ATCC 9905]|nr:hypothetical protein SGB_05290 [Shigella boydii ATCC 9905]